MRVSRWKSSVSLRTYSTLHEHLVKLGTSQSDSTTYAEIIERCTQIRALQDGRAIHSHMRSQGADGGTYLGNKLVQMYIKCGALREARETVYSMKEQTVVTWTVNIAAFLQNGYHREAIFLFKEMQLKGIHPDKVSFVTVLSACAACESLFDGKQIHQNVMESGHERNSTVGSALINMYGKCSCVEDASRVFGKLERCHVGSWSSLLGAYSVGQEHALQGLMFYQEMQLEGVKPDMVTLVTVVKLCTVVSDLGKGRLVHEHILESGLETELILGNALVNMYGKCGSPEDSYLVFTRMENLNVVSWTSIIGTFSQYTRLGGECMTLFRKMMLQGVMSNKVTMVAVLRACNSSDGRQVHGYILDMGIPLEVAVGNALVDMYSKCGDVEEACAVLKEMHRRDVISWNIVISGYAQKGLCKEGLKCLRLMQQDGLLPSKVSYVTLLSSCSTEADLEEGRLIHRSIVDSGMHTEEVVKSFLLGMYGKCGSLREVERSSAQVYDKNTIAWNTIIGAYARTGHYQCTFLHFQQMQLEGVKPDAVTFVLMLGSCNTPQDIHKGVTLHRWMEQLGFDSVIIYNALVGMYAKCGALGAAEKAFQGIPFPNSVSWNSLISAYVQHGRYTEAFSTFRKMNLEGLKPDEVTYITMVDACTKNGYTEGGIRSSIRESGFDKSTRIGNALIVMYGTFGEIQRATEVFDSMELYRNTVSWNAMIQAYLERGCSKKAMELFWKMDVSRDQITYVAALDACSNLTELSRGKLVHKLFEDEALELDVKVATALVNMYGKCGSLERARRIFDGVLERDVVMFTSLIVAYAQHNETEQALKLMKLMEQEGVRVDDVVFVSILSGCDHAGFLEDGCKYFVSMFDDYGIIPRLEHFNCMIDVLGRAGHLDAAESLIDRLPLRCDVRVWMTLLAASKIHENVELAKVAAKRILRLDPGNPAAYVVLSNVYIN